MGGLSEEREISLKTGGAVLSCLVKSGYKAVGIDAGRDLAGRISGEGVEVAFVALHGRYGEDGCVQGLLEVMEIPYTGSGVMASAVAMDKAATKKVLSYHAVPTPAFRIVAPGGRVTGLKLPLIVKPVAQGSAIGVTVVRKRAGLDAAVNEACRYGPLAIVEEFIAGRELTVSILDSTVLPVIEIRPRAGFYDYRAKYTKGETEFIVPARLKKRVEKRVRAFAIDSYEALGCRGAARVDMVLDGEENPYVLEVNTVPGLTETSLFPKAAASAGLSYRGLVKRMLEGASTGKF